MLAWVAMMPCVGLVAAALPCIIGLGGYGLYIYAAGGFESWSPQFALLWALIQFSLQAVILSAYTFLADDRIWLGDSDSSASNGTVVEDLVLADLELWVRPQVIPGRSTKCTT